jgi:hypothetical protein
MKCVEHVARMKETRITCNILTGKRKKVHLRLRHRQEKKNKMDLKGIRWVYGFDLHGTGRLLVKTVMDLRVP